MAIIMDGKALSAKIRIQIREQSAQLEAETGIKPGLAVIIVGEDPASKIYVRNKAKGPVRKWDLNPKYTSFRKKLPRTNCSTL